MHKGEASLYTLDDRLLNLHDFAVLLACCPADGTDDESEWPEQFVGERQVIDGAIDDSGGRGFAAILRLVTVERTSEPSNSCERTVVLFWAEHSGRHIPLLSANERLIERKEIASYLGGRQHRRTDKLGWLRPASECRRWGRGQHPQRR